ncbi:MAG: hypothetical protein B6U72_06125 [Candidatus Altiarchaeales archaeon ex4484_2]|nr:MAG: hypothetical protein B6U72_06125 [Candidatus Altiarchaeales archaeon ex4484_2]
MKTKKLTYYLFLLLILIGLMIALDFFLKAEGGTLDEYVDSVKGQYLTYLPRVIGTLIVLFMAKIFIDIISAGMMGFLDKMGDRGLEIMRIYRYAMWALTLILAMSILIEDLSTFVMSMGLIGFGLTFALQTPISCFVAWLMIMMNKPYRINDRISVGKRLEGDVVEITIFYTLLREVKSGGAEVTGRLITFPNNVILTEEIVNYTLDVEYIWDEINVSVTYESDRLLAEKTAYECANEVIGDIMKNGAEAMRKISRKRRSAISRGLTRSIADKPQIRVELADSAFIVGVRYITLARNRRKLRTKIYQKILDSFREKDSIGIAYPHMEVIRHKEKSTTPP